MKDSAACFSLVYCEWLAQAEKNKREMLKDFDLLVPALTEVTSCVYVRVSVVGRTCYGDSVAEGLVIVIFIITMRSPGITRISLSL